MMKANELRIGNWINYKGEPIPVTMVGLYGVQSKTDERLINASFHTPDLNPIPLTPEILGKAGFVNRKLNIFYFFENGNLVIEGSEYDYNGLFIGKIEYLHQLQNLYFALTGEELPINFKDLTYQ